MPGNGWKCSRCTFDHQFPGTRCVMCNAQRITKEQLADFVNGVPIPESSRVNSSTVSAPEPPGISKLAKESAQAKANNGPTAAQQTEGPHQVNQPPAKEFFTTSARTAGPRNSNTKAQSSSPNKSRTANNNPNNHDRSNGPQNAHRNPFRRPSSNIISTNANANSIPNLNENCDPQQAFQANQNKAKNSYSYRHEKSVIHNTNTKTNNRQANSKRPPARNNQTNKRGNPHFLKPQLAPLPYTPGPVPVDLSALSQWVYPTSQKYAQRDYQLEMSQTALFHNTLVSLPTGLGKTMIAAVVLYNYYRWFPNGKLIFCCPTQPLVVQQVEACFKIVGIPELETAVLTGKTSAEDRERLWKERRVFFCTPQTVQNDIVNPNINIPSSKVVCVILDEVHKASGDHAYVKVIELLEQEGAKFRVVGLSATPGSSIEAVQDVINVLRVSKIECRSDDDASIQKYVHNRTHEIVEIEEGDQAREMKELILKMMPKYLKKAQQQGYLNNVGSGATMASYSVLKARNSLKESFQSGHPVYKSMMPCLEVVRLLSEWRQAVQEHGIGQVIRNKINNFVLQNRKWGDLADLRQNEHFEQLQQMLRGVTESTQGLTQVDRVPNNKMIKLAEVLKNHFEIERAMRSKEKAGTTNDDGTERPSSTRAIVFSQLRDSVKEIVNALKRSGCPLIKPARFVGQSKGSNSLGKGAETNQREEEKGMNQAKQQHVLQAFRNGEYNVLICTSIGEEGLDIGEVDLIVNFDSLNSPIRMLQRVGRTGRARDGKVVSLLTATEKRKHFASKSKEKLLLKAMKDCAHLKFHPNKPMLPADQPSLEHSERELQPGDEKINWSLVGGNHGNRGGTQRKRRRRGEVGAGKRVKADDQSWKLTEQEEQLRRAILGERIVQCCTTDAESSHGFPISLRQRFLKARRMSYTAQTPNDLSRYPLGRTLVIARSLQEKHGKEYNPSEVAVARSFFRDNQAAQTLFPVKEEDSVACSLSGSMKRFQNAAQTAREAATATASTVPQPERRVGYPTMTGDLGGSADSPPKPSALPKPPESAHTLLPTGTTVELSGSQPNSSARPQTISRKQPVVNPYKKSSAPKNQATNCAVPLASESEVVAPTSESDKAPPKPSAALDRSNTASNSTMDASRVGSSMSSKELVSNRNAGRLQGPLHEGGKPTLKELPTQQKEAPPGNRAVNAKAFSTKQPVHVVNPYKKTLALKNQANRPILLASESEFAALTAVSDKALTKPAVASDGSHTVPTSAIHARGCSSRQSKDLVGERNTDRLQEPIHEGEKPILDESPLQQEEPPAEQLLRSNSIEYQVATANPSEEKRNETIEFCLPTPPDSSSEEDDSDDEDDVVCTNKDDNQQGLAIAAVVPADKVGQSDAKVTNGNEAGSPESLEQRIVIENLPTIKSKNNADGDVDSRRSQAGKSVPSPPQEEWRLPTQSSSSSEDESESETECRRDEEVHESTMPTSSPAKKLPPKVEHKTPVFANGSNQEEEEEEDEDDDDDDMPLIAMREKATGKDDENSMFAKKRKNPSQRSRDLSHDSGAEVVCHRKGHSKQRVDPFLTQHSPPSQAANNSPVESLLVVDTSVQPQESDELGDPHPESPDSEIGFHRKGQGKKPVDPYLAQNSPFAEDGAHNSPSMSSNNLADTPDHHQGISKLGSTPPENRDSEVVCRLKGQGKKSVDPFLTQHSPNVVDGAYKSPAVNLVDTPTELTRTKGAGQTDGDLADTPRDHCSPNADDLDEVACALCLSKEFSDSDPILLCDGFDGKGKSCSLSVHLSCYSVDKKILEDDESVPWRCDPCALRHKVFVTKEIPVNQLQLMKCCACQNPGGPLKRVSKQIWTHPYCAQWSNDLPGKGEKCSICNLGGAVPCGKEGCAVAVHPHCAIRALASGGSKRWTLLRVNFPESGADTQALSMLFCEEDTAEAENMARTFCSGGQHDNAEIVLVPPNRFDLKSLAPAARAVPQKRRLKKLKSYGDQDTSDEKKREVIDVDNVPTTPMESEEARRSRKRARLERRKMARQFMDEEAGVESDEGGEAEDRELAALEAEEESTSSFINDSSQLGLSGRIEGYTGRDSISCYSANNGTMHRRVDNQYAIDNQYTTPFLNRNMQRDSLTPGSAPASEQGLGKMHFVRSVLEHHRNGGDAEEIESFYNNLQQEEHGEEDEAEAEREQRNQTWMV